MVAFVRDNNIYVAKLDYGTEVVVIKDGKRNEIINGVPDWVYQEEFGMLSSPAWSPDNSIPVLEMDESAVKMYDMPLYRGSCDEKPEYNDIPEVSRINIQLLARSTRKSR